MPPQVVISKLKRLNNTLKTRNWEVFRDLNANITGKSTELQSIQFQMFSKELFLVEYHVHHVLDMLLLKHEYFYRDRSRVKWLQVGDHNSSFFHASVRRKQYQKALSSLLINRVLTDDRLVNRDHIIDFYSDIFSLDPSRVETDLSEVKDVIPSIVTDAENAFLTGISLVDDIHDTVFAMDMDFASRLDGFSGDRFAQIVARFASLHRFGFIWDRHIEDCIALASDYVNMLQKKYYEGNLAMKIDIRKAFDTLD
ncbi:hypothetical protein Dsin_005675 [Dipteronia sinensis]|uniref:Reverse transcriptase domain-containing protein n=1 Tax=Dipteronia sinensis TaxID=43782 RepID=A0AAE0AXR7_9ROSI|nr:hypothetical protein Dsin_005675 [Dipteronia sinensis]